MRRQDPNPFTRLDYLDARPKRDESRAAVTRGVCPKCGRALKCTAYQPPSTPRPTATWSCSCGFSVTMPKASQLYRRARLEFGDTQKYGDNGHVGRAAIP